MVVEGAGLDGRDIVGVVNVAVGAAVGAASTLETSVWFKPRPEPEPDSPSVEGGDCV